MITITSTIAKLGVAIVTLAILLRATPCYAAAYLSSTGLDSNPCTAAQPCQTFSRASSIDHRVLCINAPAFADGIILMSSNQTFTLDCAGVWTVAGIAIDSPATNVTIRIRNLTFTGLSVAILETGSGTVIFENCVFEDMSGVAIDIEPTGPVNLVIRNSRISNGGSGILLKPMAGGSIKATLDHVVITGSSGGGIKADSTNGVIDLDVSNCEISNNGGNGINAVGTAANQDIVSIKSSVISRNGAAGVQANGTSAGVLAATTLFDQNAAGATSVVSGGNMFTYGNNDIVGSLGSGFTMTAPLH